MGSEHHVSTIHVFEVGRIAAKRFNWMIVFIIYGHSKASGEFARCLHFLLRKATNSFGSNLQCHKMDFSIFDCMRTTEQRGLNRHLRSVQSMERHPEWNCGSLQYLHCTNLLHLPAPRKAGDGPLHQEQVRRVAGLWILEWKYEYLKFHQSSHFSNENADLFNVNGTNGFTLQHAMLSTSIDREKKKKKMENKPMETHDFKNYSHKL